MMISDLTLNINPEGSRLFVCRNQTAEFKSFKEKVLKRDDYTCQFCGFRAKEYQDIINLDQNYQNNKLSNLVVACPFCSQCCFMESIGGCISGGGVLIYLPEMTQLQLNGLCHVLFCAIANENYYKTIAQDVYRSLKQRMHWVEKQLGEGFTDPTVLAQLMIETNVPRLDIHPLLGHLRLLPSRASFSEQIATWLKQMEGEAEAA